MGGQTVGAVEKGPIEHRLGKHLPKKDLPTRSIQGRSCRQTKNECVPIGQAGRVSAGGRKVRP
jgi:hypothetical protein